MRYKNYEATIDYDEERHIFHGRVINVNDVINFYGTTPDELEQEMRTSVEEYLAFCKKVGKSSEKPFSGKLLIRTSPESHRLLVEAAARAHISLNQWAQQALIQAASQRT